jgi:hypothetical protein
MNLPNQTLPAHTELLLATVFARHDEIGEARPRRSKVSGCYNIRESVSW